MTERIKPADIFPKTGLVETAAARSPGSIPVTAKGPYVALLKACGSNKHDKALILIAACIGDGVNTKGSIIAAGKRAGLDSGHVAITLDRATGSIPTAHRWRRGADGVYALLD